MYIEQIDASDNNDETTTSSTSNHHHRREDFGFPFVRIFRDCSSRARFFRIEHDREAEAEKMSQLSNETEDSREKRFMDEEEKSARECHDDCQEKSLDGKIVDEKSEPEKNGHRVYGNGHKEASYLEIPTCDNFEYEIKEESADLFDNEVKSIFSRKSSGPAHNDDSSTRRVKTDLANGEKAPIQRVEKIPRKLEKKRAISFVDILLSVFVVGPIVIGQWRGIWTMMDIYGEFFPEWLCFILGMGLHVIFAIGRNVLHGRFVEKLRMNNGRAGRVAYDLVRLLYIYVFCVACNAHWRGGWAIFSHYCGNDVWVVSFLTTILAAGLVMLRSFRNLIAPPFIVIIDEPDRVFQFPTRYNVSTRDWCLYILDCAFSVGVVGSLVVFVWRGVWVLFELHLFPENREYSAIGSLVIGYILVAVTFCLQPLMRYTCSRLKGLARLLAADAFLLLSFLGTVNVWRGIWTVLDLWLLPEDIELSCWITHVGCFVFLVLLNCSNSILVRGVYIDAEEEEGRCVVFPCHYLRLFFKIERQKKEARRQNLMEARKEPQPRNEAIAKELENETLLNCANAIPTIKPASPESFV